MGLAVTQAFTGPDSCHCEQMTKFTEQNFQREHKAAFDTFKRHKDAGDHIFEDISLRSVPQIVQSYILQMNEDVFEEDSQCTSWMRTQRIFFHIECLPR